MSLALVWQHPNMVIHTLLIWHLFGWNWTDCWSLNTANGHKHWQRVSVSQPTPWLTLFCIDFLLNFQWFLSCYLHLLLKLNVHVMLLHNGVSHAEYLLIMFALWVKDFELLPELQRSESQPNLAMEPFPNMSIGWCVCVVMPSMMWPAKSLLVSAYLEQHRTGITCMCSFYWKHSKMC